VALTASGALDVQSVRDFEHGPPEPLERRFQLVWRLSKVALFLQLVGMIVFTTVQYDRFALTIDFANYSQAWSAIAHGHLDPYSTLAGVRFLHNDLELLMWPLALFYWLYPHAVILLWLQACAIVGAELVVLAWAKDSVIRSGYGRAQGVLILGFVTVLLVATPWSWFTLGFDFHFEPFAALFALLAARDLWAGRYSHLVAWVPLTLMSCAAAGSLYVIAIGLAALVTKRGPRQIPVFVMLAGCLWLTFAAALGAMAFAGPDSLASSYGYLTGQVTSHLSYSQALVSLVEHPLRALDMFRSHAGYVTGYVVSGGVIGLMSRWGLFPAAIVLLPSALNGNIIFIRFAAAFQSWPAVLFLIIGSVLALQRLSAGNRRSSVVAVFGVMTLAVAVAVAALTAPEIPFFFDRVSPAAAAKLAALNERVPKGAELVVSQGIVGRFAIGRSAYFFPRAAEGYPVSRAGKPVWFILGATAGTSGGYVAETLQAVLYLERSLHATPVSEGADIWAFEWTPPRGVTSIVLP
jgi:hypothetical protein